ncbi:acyl-CoA dehydrogenase, partial [Oceanicola sp. 22II-s10i]
MARGDADPAHETLRQEVRAFLATATAHMTPHDRAASWMGHDAEFSRKLAARGWLGMTMPKRLGGHDRSPLDRHVVLEELLAAGAPVAAHWIADRQSAPLVLRFGTPEQIDRAVPGVIRGETYCCIGMSEPDSGSDLAATRTRARKVEGGWRVDGTKLWTTYAHRSTFMVLFCRTDRGDGNTGTRHASTSQFLVDLDTPGITVRPILDLAGEHHFNEVNFEDVFLPDDALIGSEGQGWDQVTSELALERSGPERFLSSITLLIEMIRQLESAPDEMAVRTLGRVTANLIVLRQMSFRVATLLTEGQDAALQATMVKDLGALFEQEIPELARSLVTVEPTLDPADGYAAVLGRTLAAAPSFSLRGGTREILRGIIARG